MATSAYQLEAPRPRYNVPPPLNFQASPFAQDDPEPLLYDNNATTSPPTSPRNRNNRSLASPTSPTFNGRSRKLRNGRPTPPPSGRNHSNPPGLQASDLEKFAEQCRAWYFDQDDAAGQLMTQTLATVPPSQRAPLSRLQASIRSAYHRSVNTRKTAEFKAHLSATQPGHSLMPLSRANPQSNEAKKERYDRFERFVKTWANHGMPGTTPFFQGLWAVMRLQVIPEDLGGAGRNRLEWELDDAVFKESAGKDFMHEAVDVLKGVLGFEEHLSPNHVRSSTSSFKQSPADLLLQHSRSRSQPIPSIRTPPSDTPSSHITTNSVVMPKRPRAPSDPFLDTSALSSSIASSSSHSIAVTPSTSDIILDEPSPSSATLVADKDSSPDILKDLRFDPVEEEQLRVWTTPDLPNPEILALLQCFPAFITRHTLPRFPILPERDIEEGAQTLDSSDYIRCGTGLIGKSDLLRRDGWQGGWWTRFILWWRRLFC